MFAQVNVEAVFVFVSFATFGVIADIGSGGCVYALMCSALRCRMERPAAAFDGAYMRLDTAVSEFMPFQIIGMLKPRRAIQVVAFELALSVPLHMRIAFVFESKALLTDRTSKRLFVTVRLDMGVSIPRQ
jgi:hypothetical protein